MALWGGGIAGLDEDVPRAERPFNLVLKQPESSPLRSAFAPLPFSQQTAGGWPLQFARLNDRALQGRRCFGPAHRGFAAHGYSPSNPPGLDSSRFAGVIGDKPPLAAPIHESVLMREK